MSNSNLPSEERYHLRRLRDLHITAQENRCYFCDVEMTAPDVPDPKPGTTATIEHLKGRASGGGSNYLNTAASCLNCNNARAHQRQVGRTTVPRIKVRVKKMFTYAYTTTREPFVLVLANSALPREEAMVVFRENEGSPINLKNVSALH